MKNNVRRAGIKRLYAVFLVIVAFSFCAFSVFADSSVIVDSALEDNYVNALSESYSAFSFGDECSSLLFRVDMNSTGNCPYNGRIYVETSEGDIILNIESDYDSEGTIYIVRFTRLDSSTFTSDYSLKYYLTGDINYVPPGSAVCYVSIEFDSIVQVNNIYAVKTGNNASDDSWTIGVNANIYAVSPSILDEVGTVTNTVLDVVGSTAQTIINNSLLLLVAVGLPVVSFGAGMLIRLFRRV